MAEQRFFDISNRSDMPFQIILGGRGIGKTYSALDYLQKVSSPSHKFIYMRREGTEIDQCATEYGNPYKKLNEDKGYHIEPFVIPKFKGFGFERQIRSTVEQCGINCSVEYKGKTYTLGLWEEDGTYKQFKTMGAKKYAYVDSNDHFSITVAGLSKEKGRQYIEKIGGLKAFNETTVVPKYSSGRLSAHYNDEPCVKNMNINGHFIPVGSNVVLLETEYSFSITDEYEKLLESLHAEIF